MLAGLHSICKNSQLLAGYKKLPNAFEGITLLGSRDTGSNPVELRK
jgi:hypothetical protein